MSKGAILGHGPEGSHYWVPAGLVPTTTKATFKGARKTFSDECIAYTAEAHNCGLTANTAILLQINLEINLQKENKGNSKELSTRQNRDGGFSNETTDDEAPFGLQTAGGAVLTALVPSRSAIGA